MSTTVLAPSPALDELLSDMETAAADTIKRHSAAPGATLADGTPLPDGGVAQMMARAESAKTSAEAIQASLPTYPFAPGATGPSAAEETRLRGFLRDIRFDAAPQAGMRYVLASAERAKAGLWRFYIWSVNAATGAFVENVSAFSTSTNPEPTSPARSDVEVTLTPVGTGGIGGRALVRWSALLAGATIQNASSMTLAAETFAPVMPAWGGALSSLDLSRRVTTLSALDERVAFAANATGTAAATLRAAFLDVRHTATLAAGRALAPAVVRRAYSGTPTWLINIYDVSTSNPMSGYVLVAQFSTTSSPEALAEVVIPPVGGSGVTVTAKIDWTAIPTGTSLENQLGMFFDPLTATGRPAASLGQSRREARIAALEASAERVPVLGRQYLRAWHAALARTASGGQAVVVDVGDSWRERYPISQAQRDTLVARHGDAGAGIWWFAASYALSPFTGRSTSPWGTSSGQWTRVDEDVPGRGLAIMHVQGTSSGLFVQATVTGTDLWLHLAEGGGAIRYSVDGGATWTALDTGTLSGYTRLPLVTGGANVARTVRVETTNTGLVRLVGLEARNASAGVRQYQAGNGSAKASHFLAAPAAEWQANLTALAPDLVTVLLGTNDVLAAVAPTTFASQLTSLVGRIRTAAPSASVMLIVPADEGTAGKTYTTRQYADVVRPLSTSLGVCVLDLREAMGEYAGGQALGFYEDPSHLSNGTGSRTAAAWIAEALRLG